MFSPGKFFSYRDLSVDRNSSTKDPRIPPGYRGGAQCVCDSYITSGHGAFEDTAIDFLKRAYGSHLDALGDADLLLGGYRTFGALIQMGPTDYRLPTAAGSFGEYVFSWRSYGKGLFWRSGHSLRSVI